MMANGTGFAEFYSELSGITDMHPVVALSMVTLVIVLIVAFWQFARVQRRRAQLGEISTAASLTSKPGVDRGVPPLRERLKDE